MDKLDGIGLAKVLAYYGIELKEKIICPFHGDINPSMKIDLVNGTFYCFGCGLSGNAYDFVKAAEKDKCLNDLEYLLLTFKIIKSNKIEKIQYIQGNVIDKSPEYYKESLEEAKYYYESLRTINWKKDEYKDIIDHARKYMIDRGFTLNTLNNCKAKYTYNDSYEVIFPMYDNKKFKGWVCRTTKKDIEKKRKYLYNTGFHRRTTLVGDYRGQKVVYIVEGYMDWLKARQFGIKNAVAILGWKMTQEQEIKLKEEGVQIIISALDNDEYGRKGTDHLMRRFNKVVRFAYLKGYKDLGEMSAEQFNKMNNKTIEKVNKLGQ